MIFLRFKVHLSTRLVIKRIKTTWDVSVAELQQCYSIPKSAVRIGDECWILRSFDWSVILKKASHYVIVAEVVIFEEQEVNGQRKLVESQVLDGSLANSETA
jgi:hypothetical protein